MTGEIRKSDEYFVLSGVEYHFMFPPQTGALGFASSSPFAPKTTSGARNYSDYDSLSYLAMVDFSGGIGQERLTDATKYYDGTNVDTRGGRIAPRPMPYVRGSSLSNEAFDADVSTWYSLRDGTQTGIASRFIAGATGAVYRFLVALRGYSDLGTVVVCKLFDQVGGLPGNELASVTIANSAITNFGRWLEAPIAGSEQPSANLLLNPSWDANTTNWVAGGDAVLTSVTGGQLNNCLQMYDGYTYQSVQLTPNATYTLSWWHKNGTVDGQVRIGTFEGGANIYNGAQLNNTNWTKYSTVFNAGATGLVFITLVAVITLTEHTTLFDEISLTGGLLASSPVTLTAGSSYWVAVMQTAGTDSAVKWLGTDADVAGYAAYDSGAWALGAGGVGPAMGFVLNIAAYAPDEPLVMLAGAGEDLIPRIWGYAGRCLYYLGLESIIPVEESEEVHTTKILGADIADAVWYRVESDDHANLYLALGDATDMQTFDGNIGHEQWAAVTGHQAHKLAVHDDLLWIADERTIITGYNGTKWATALVAVGDKTWPIINMVSWQGYLYIGKADGLYRLSYSFGYPTGDIPPSVDRILDLTTQADADNFVLMCVHQDDLYFSIGQGLMRYTRGNVLTSVAPETGLDQSVSSRSRYLAAASTLATLWVGTEGRLDDYSAVLGVYESKWHSLYSEIGTMIRSLVLEPGYLAQFNAPTLHFSRLLQVVSLPMPTTTNRTWLWDGIAYETIIEAILYTSWFDGGINVIDKDWIECLVDVKAYNLGFIGYVDVYWRPDEVTAWVQLGARITASGLTTLAFAANSYSKEIQIKVVIVGGSDGCLMVKALVLGYMERPEDLRTYTRTYRLASKGTWRNGTPFQLSLAEQVENVRTLRGSKEPLTHYTWFGAARTVHIVDYNAAEGPEEQRPVSDDGSITVVMRLVEI